MSELTPRILVFGVGGAGGNAVNNMIAADLQGVAFIAANTDAQALARSNASHKLQLGVDLTSGLGAGARPDVGAASAEESEAEIRETLDGAHMIFIAAGMGGGTGTGAAPVIARIAREMNILTVGVVTKPFAFEGARRMEMAERGIEELRPMVDTLIIVPNQNLFRITNDKTPIAAAFQMADEVLHAGVRGVTDLMVMPGLINLDFADVRTIMSNGGPAMMGTGEASGEGRALEAARAAITNPLLDDVSMKGARGVLINITGGYDITLFEVDEAANAIREQVDPNANIILGSTFDTEMEGTVRVSVVATGLVEADGQRLAPIEARDEDKPSFATEMPKVSIVRPSVVDDSADEPEAETESDPRPDFTGRPLPPSHLRGTNGDGQVPTDRVFSRREAGNDEKLDGFSKLFGWRRGDDADMDGEDEDRGVIVSKPDESIEPAPFDDDDLEIPAFLRRSAGH